MSIKKITVIPAVLLVAMFTVGMSSKSALDNQSKTWLLIDDFESGDLSSWTKRDTHNNTSPHVENPQVMEIREEFARNHYLLKKPAPDGVVGNRKALSFIALPTQVNVGEIYTFYTRFNVEYFPNNHIFGISNLDAQGIAEKGYDAFEPSLRITDKAESNGDKNDGTLMVKLDNGYAKVKNYAHDRDAKPLKPSTWYEAWTVVDNRPLAEGGQSYQVYLRGGEFTEAVLVYDKADFRMKREQTLRYFLTNANTGPAKKPYGNGGVRYDDLYMSKGVNLSTPNE